MSNKTRRTEIQIETHEVTVIRTRGGRFLNYCARCEAMVTAFTPAQLGALFPLPEVWRRVAADELHLVQNQQIEAMVCGNSLESKTS